MAEAGDGAAIASPLGRPIKRRLGRRLLGCAVLVLACVGLVAHREVKNFKVTSGSMEPTLPIGDRVTVEPGTQVPAVGNIIVFHPPSGARPIDPVCGSSAEGAGTTQPCGVSTSRESSAVFIKRVVAGPGETVSIVDGRVVRDGRVESEPQVAPCDGATCSFPTAITVPAGQYYVLGDNRAISDDSRYWGPVPGSWIIGTAVRCALLQTICHPLR